MGDRRMPSARDPHALLCLNLRKEWAGDQREIAAQLERQAWCLDEARRSGWSVFHAHEARGRSVNPDERGALRGLAPQRNEPVFVVAGDRLFADDALQEALRASAARCVYVIGIGRTAALAKRAACDVRVIGDAFVELGAADLGVVRVLSTAAFRVPSAEIVELKTWRRERTSEGVE